MRNEENKGDGERTEDTIIIPVRSCSTEAFVVICKLL